MSKKTHASNRKHAKGIKWFRWFDQDRLSGPITEFDLPNQFGVAGNRIILSDGETSRKVSLVEAIDAYILNEEVSNASSGTAVELLKVVRRKLTGKSQPV